MVKSQQMKDSGMDIVHVHPAFRRTKANVVCLPDGLPLNQPITRPSTASVEAYNFYLKGRYHWNRRGQEALYKAIVPFRPAKSL